MKGTPVIRLCFSRKYFAFFLCIMLFFWSGHSMIAQVQITSATPVDANSGRWVLVIHGGAGGPAKGSMPAEVESAYLKKLDEALKLGSGILSAGGSSLDAVEVVVRFMEDCPLFNAGKGCVLNENGKAELDAAIMDGRTGMAGAVAGVTTIKNPVTAARSVMEKSNNVMLIGNGAEKFAKSQGLDLVEPAYFITPERLKAWEKWKANLQAVPVKSPAKPDKKPAENEKHGTVGAVAMDQHGNLAAATSTGGMMGKMAGRVGDSPIIGAGTYANNQTCAVSATGQGEFFMRNVVAFDLSAMMEYRGMPLEEAGKMIIMDKLVQQKANGGLIAVDREGNICMPFNTNAMYRGFTKSSGEHEVAIY